MARSPIERPDRRTSLPANPRCISAAGTWTAACSTATWTTWRSGDAPLAPRKSARWRRGHLRATLERVEGRRLEHGGEGGVSADLAGAAHEHVVAGLVAHEAPAHPADVRFLALGLARNAIVVDASQRGAERGLRRARHGGADGGPVEG